MAKCTKCGSDTIGNTRICRSCLRKWTDMRGLAYTTLTSIYGDMTHSNHIIFKKEMKRLEKIWRKDKDKFQIEIELLNDN